jgi:hypothetical protein
VARPRQVLDLRAEGGRMNRASAETAAGRRAFLRSADLGRIRYDAGIPVMAIAAVLGCDRTQPYHWEKRQTSPSPEYAGRYVRIIAGLARHLEIPEGSRT